MTSRPYITMQGDTWDAIAYRLWGQERLLSYLIEANPEYLDTVVFGPGVNLIIPQRPAVETALDLPPWRK